MARFYKIQIAGIWLTSDGTEDGRPCKNEVSPVSSLFNETLGNNSVGVGGTPWRETPLTDGGGRGFSITIPVMKQTVYDALKSALDTAASTNAEYNITGEGATGDFDVDAIVFDNPAYLSAGAFSGDDIKNVQIWSMTTQINAI